MKTFFKTDKSKLDVDHVPLVLAFRHFPLLPRSDSSLKIL